ncbi:MAG: hypothetical protein Q9213_008110 [Squamulea squamosa]
MTSLLPLLKLFSYIHCTQAAPTRNLTELHVQYAPSFVAEPNGRGTWSLLYSCIFTLALCLWTAFHPNVKSPEASKAAKYTLKWRWLAVAVFAPELGVLTAFKQFRQSRALAAELSRLREKAAREKSAINTRARSKQKFDGYSKFKKSECKNEPSCLPHFSHTYGFYVLMGGLAVNVHHLHDRLERVLLTPSGLKYLAEKGYFFEVADTDIQDKSKASWLAKGFVLLQITWTVLQCLSRKAVGLPLSVLEVHVLVHAGCALIMYVLWFNKPMDVDEPMDVTSEIPEKIVALMLVRNHHFGTEPYRNLEIPIEYCPVRLSGTKFGVWPSCSVSEAAYLMYNPRTPNIPPNSDDPSTSMQDGTSALDNQSNNGVPQLPLTKSDDPTTHLKTGQSAESEEYVHHAALEGQNNHAIVPTLDSRTSSILEAYQCPSLLAQPDSGGDCLSTPTAQISSARASSVDLDCDPIPCTPVNSVNQSKNICHGFTCKPACGGETVATITTGSFVENGIGPKAYLTGKWRGNFVPWQPGRGPFKLPDGILQIPEELRMRLPLDAIDPKTIVHYFPLTISLTEKDIKRWRLAGSALYDELGSSTVQVPDHGPYMDFSNQADTIQGAYFTIQALLIGWQAPVIEDIYPARWGSPTFSGRYIPLLRGLYYRLRELGDLDLGPTTAVTMLPGLLYGGLHLTLWNYKFPTYIEGMLWRLSAVTILAVPAVAALFVILHSVYHKWVRKETHLQEKYGSSVEGRDTFPSDKAAQQSQRRVYKFVTAAKRGILLDLWLLAWISLLMIGFLYVFSRVFIIVESFISLRHVPVGVYTDVGWSKYIPHL